MGFINAYITPEDREAYQLDAVDKQLGRRSIQPNNWTVDQEHRTYLRKIRNLRGPEDPSNTGSEWTLFSNKNLFFVEIEVLGGGGETNGPGWRYIRIIRIRHINQARLPTLSEQQTDQIKADLYTSLLASKEGDGIYSSRTEFELKLEYAEGAL